MVCYRCSIICRITLVVTRPMLVPALAGPALGEAVRAWSFSTRAYPLVRRAIVGSRFCAASIVAVPCVFVARASRGARVQLSHPHLFSPCSRSFTVILKIRFSFNLSSFIA